MPRNRDARLAVLGSPVPRSRPAGLSSRSTTALRRRIVAGLLVFLSIVLITIYFREPSNGGLHGVQSAGATVLRPFEVGAERVAQPFRDAYGWFARARAREIGELAPAGGGRQVQPARDPERERGAAERRPQAPAPLRRLARVPAATTTTSRPTSSAAAPSEFDQRVTIAAGSTSAGSASRIRS